MILLYGKPSSMSPDVCVCVRVCVCVCTPQVIRRGQDRIFSYTEGGPIPADLNRQRSVVSAFSDEKLVTLRKNKATQCKFNNIIVL